MTTTPVQKKQIVDSLKAGKRQYEIAKELNISRSIVQHYAKTLKFEANLKDPSKYFNVDIYAKTISTI